MVWQLKSDQRTPPFTAHREGSSAAPGIEIRATDEPFRKTSSQDLRLRTLRVLPRLVSDLVSVAVGIAVFWRIHGGFEPSQIYYAAGYMTIAATIDATHVRRAWNYVEEFVVGVKTAFWSTVLVAAAAFFVDRSLSRVLFGSVAVVMVVLRPMAAAVADRISHRQMPQLVCVVSSRKAFDELQSAVREVKPSKVTLHRAPFVELAEDDSSVAVTGDLVSWCQDVRPTKVVVGDGVRSNQRLLNDLARTNEFGIRISSIGRFIEDEFNRVRLGSLDTSWFVFDIGPLHRLGYRFARRIVDILSGVLAGAALILLLPALALAVKVDSKGPLFFSQKRVGQGGKIFTLHKIRSMTLSAEQQGPQFAAACDERVTRVGRVMRRCRLDELPQAVNLIRGDLSLIGPRPERPEWVATYKDVIPFYDKRTIVKPGITGWAQVHEGYSSSLQEAARKLERDLYYIRYQSLGLDLRIALMTIWSVMRFQGR